MLVLAPSPLMLRAPPANTENPAPLPAFGAAAPISPMPEPGARTSDLGAVGKVVHRRVVADRTLGWIGLSFVVGAALAVWGLAAQPTTL